MIRTNASKEGLSNQVLVDYQKSPCGAQYSQNGLMFNSYLAFPH
ncbi:hypothetical protein CEV34_0817 [Brucella pseudogrignonensis]|uniref:Uncharacterized protein n=1 Tax=Brucella pseudogrignonensis TaxID=419475 RepID=A0A256GRI7_9HYPH|nr:hypothetical protein CEV34_0817 [Brucella pseudogrignonensis]